MIASCAVSRTKQVDFVNNIVNKLFESEIQNRRRQPLFTSCQARRAAGKSGMPTPPHHINPAISL
ncbi:MAG: hypothetical protein A3I66_00305 [Burkholderiales bacterium RIFCSPLOWO2_02_FULL_57_36]|nr:MAG: hypothetical protein A3I66_00305 [Burkholderiales bacterium RIFCSPLOWO2_02_FULL_57_36]